MIIVCVSYSLELNNFNKKLISICKVLKNQTKQLIMTLRTKNKYSNNASILSISYKIVCNKCKLQFEMF